MEVWEKIPLKDYGVIFITEPIYEELRNQVLEIERSVKRIRGYESW